MSGRPAQQAAPAAADMTELLGWRLAASFIWQGLCFLVAYAVWSLAGALLVPGWPASSTGSAFASLTTFLFMCLLQAAVLFTTNMTMSASEPPPVYLPALGLHGRGWLGLLVSRVILRRRKLQELISTASLLGSTCLTAATTLYTFSPPSAAAGSSTPAWSSTTSSLVFCARYGMCLGGIYTVQHLAKCRDVLAYPSTHRHRAYQLRQRLPACAVAAVKLSSLALVCCLLLGYWPPSLLALLHALYASILCVWGWLGSQAALEVIMAEPIQLMSSSAAAAHDPVRAMLGVLADPRPMVQDLGLQELVLLSQGHTSLHRAWRAGLWADDTGRLWGALAGFLVTELKDWTMVLKSALPGAPGSSEGAPPPGHASAAGKVQWNVLALSSSTGTSVVSRAQDTAAWCIRARYYRVGCCMRALAGLAAASRAEDRYGVVLLNDPVLGDITLLLLSCILVAQQYTKAAAASTGKAKLTRVLQRMLDLTGPSAHPTLQQQVEWLSQGLEDVGRASVGQLASVFGHSLLAAVKSARVTPVFGSAAELDGLLTSMLLLKE